jgi:hypothetical protein
MKGYGTAVNASSDWGRDAGLAGESPNHSQTTIPDPNAGKRCGGLGPGVCPRVSVGVSSGPALVV